MPTARATQGKPHRPTPMPKSLRLMGFTYSVEPAPMHVIEETAGREGSVGATNRQQCRILIANWLPEQQQRATLLHEVLHVCALGVPDGWGTSGFMAGEDFNIEEIYVDGIANVLFPALCDNPALARYIAGL